MRDTCGQFRELKAREIPPHLAGDQGRGEGTGWALAASVTYRLTPASVTGGPRLGATKAVSGPPPGTAPLMGEDTVRMNTLSRRKCGEGWGIRARVGRPVEPVATLRAGPLGNEASGPRIGVVAPRPQGRSPGGIAC